MKPVRISFIVSVLLLALAIVVMAGTDADKCPLCGMNIAGNENTAYVITTKEGASTAYCCPHCGLWVHAEGKGAIKSAKARDFISGEWDDPAKMVFIFKSTAVPACAPSWIAFSKKAEAEKFQKGFGGTIYSFEEALKERVKHPKGMEM
ncbi:MAG: nitrous oxide reductase accessory protein NosL [Thermodesulfovibrionales bacterium]